MLTPLGCLRRMQADELAVLRHFPPRTLPELAALREVLLAYRQRAPATVAVGFCGVYILMQSLAIPGTLMLSLLGGGLYGLWRGWLLVAGADGAAGWRRWDVCRRTDSPPLPARPIHPTPKPPSAALPLSPHAVVSTAGSCSSYCLSWALGQPLVRSVWPDQLERYAGEVARRRGQLLNYIVFLRVTPLLPNTFINVASPIVSGGVWWWLWWVVRGWRVEAPLQRGSAPCSDASSVRRRPLTPRRWACRCRTLRWAHFSGACPTTLWR